LLDFTSQAELVVKLNSLSAIGTSQFKANTSYDMTRSLTQSQALRLTTDILLSRQADKKNHHLPITVDLEIITNILAFRFELKDITNHIFRRLDMGTIYRCGDLKSELPVYELRDNVLDCFEYVICVYEAGGLGGVVEYFEEVTLLITRLLRKHGHQDPSRINTLIRIIVEQVELSINGMCRFLGNPTEDLETKYSLLNGSMHRQMIEKVTKFSSNEDSKTLSLGREIDGVVLSYEAGKERAAKATTHSNSTSSNWGGFSATSSKPNVSWLVGGSGLWKLKLKNKNICSASLTNGKPCPAGLPCAGFHHHTTVFTGGEINEVINQVGASGEKATLKALLQAYKP
jgi:hypothetical protein